MFAVCAIAKDEPEHYVREWLDWHRSVGADRFFVYDNGGWVVDAKDIEVRPYPGLYKQMAAYNHCLRNCDGADYLAFIDVDEFLMGSIVNRLPSIENALVLNWKVFGTSGLEWNPHGKQMGVFKCCLPANHPFNTHVKSIVRPEKTIRLSDNPHCFLYVNNGLQEDYDGKKMPTSPKNKIDKFPATWINHYFTRSMYDWKMKLKRGRADCDIRRRPEAVFLVDLCCTELEGGGSVSAKFLPYIAKATYGAPPNIIDVTEKVRKMAEGANIAIGVEKYNELFGNPAPDKFKRFYVRLEREGVTVAELNISEGEASNLL